MSLSHWKERRVHGKRAQAKKPEVRELDGGVYFWRSWRFRRRCARAQRPKEAVLSFWFPAHGPQLMWQREGISTQHAPQPALMDEVDRRDTSHSAWVNRRTAGRELTEEHFVEENRIAQCFITAAWLDRFIKCSFSKIKIDALDYFCILSWDFKGIVVFFFSFLSSFKCYYF